MSDPDEDLDCADPWSEGTATAAFLEQFCFWFGGVFLCCLGVLGLVGNVVTIVVFTSKRIRSTVHELLVVLAAFDFCFLLITLLCESLQMRPPGSLNNGVKPALFVYLYPKFLYPLKQIFQTASIYMTMAICVNRYMAIVHPFHTCRRFSSHSACSIRNKCASNANSGSGSNSANVDLHVVFFWAGVVTAFSVVYCIPVFFEYHSSTNEDGHLDAMWTELRMDETYTMVYTICIDFALRIIAPVAVLIYTNVAIFLELRRHPDIGNRDRQFAVTLFLLVGVFLLCQLPKIIVNAHQFFIWDTLTKCQEVDPDLGAPAWDVAMHKVAYVLFVLNSSINVLVYTATSKRFRTTAADMMKCKKESGNSDVTREANTRSLNRIVSTSSCYLSPKE